MTGRVVQRLSLAVFLLLPSSAAAQQSGSIAGLVRDTTGAVLPGVTVEAGSPALIEKVRTVITDEAGQYRIVDLRPGVYAVTFSLPGFSSIRRDGVELTAGFTANVNAELRVGSVAETITVSGASPVVDVQNVNTQRTVTREVLDTVPSGKQFTALAQLIPGVTVAGSNGQVNQDVGGITGMSFALAAIHGGREDDQAVHINGMSVASLTSIGNSRTNLQDGNIEEYGMQLAAAPAEFAHGGLNVNVLPKQGSNAFHGALFMSGTNESLQTDNLSDDLIQRGLTVANKAKQVFDVNPSIGGPIARDKLWFYAGFRYLVTESYVGGLYYNKEPAAWTFTPDLERPALNDQDGKNESLNLTWQASPRNKFTAFYNYDFQCYCHFGINAAQSPEASHFMKSKAVLYQGTWASPITNRLLAEAGISRYDNELPRDEEPDAVAPRITEQSTGLAFRAQVNYPRNDQTIWHLRGSLSYVTGTHAVKVGFSYQDQYADDTLRSFRGTDVTYRTLNGIPNQITFYTTPYATPVTLNPIAAYAQDQWTLRRWTINAGIRFDQFKGSYDAIHVDPTQWLPTARDYPGDEVINWKDISPRLGASWDIFGTGKTALKATVNRYVLQEGKLQTSAVHPVLAATNTVARTWTDGNNDRVLQGDPLNPATNGELGPSPNNNFGKPTATLSLDPEWAKGTGTRPFNWETSIGLQHEIIPRVAVNVAYFRRIYGNFIVTDNVLVGPGDYDPYSITVPIDPRLPSGGGEVISRLYDLRPNKVGQVNQVRTGSYNYGKQYDHWNGVDITINARPGRGVILQGGVSTGKRMTDECDVTPKIDNPSPYLCHQESPFVTQAKFLGSYPLPWYGIQLSGTFQHSRPDPTGGARWTSMGMSAQYVATNAVIAPSLGRNLSSGAGGSVTLNIVEPGSMFLDYSNQLDLRVSKTFSVRTTRIQGLFDLYNLFNANPVMRYNTAYGTNGANWLVPQSLLPGRLLRLGMQVTF
jgi:hypothetical protein